MNDPRATPGISCCRTGCVRGCLGLMVSLLAAGQGLAAAANPAASAAESGAVVAKNASPAGALLQSDTSKQGWHAVKPQESVSGNQHLMALPGFRAEVDSKSAAVRLSLWGNLPEFSLFPGLESVVALHANPAADMDFTLERGRVLITQRKGKESARVHVRFQGREYALNLNEPGTEVALELYGRWPRGTPFTKKQPTKNDAEAEDGPTLSVVLLVLKGQADLKVGSEQHSLRPPPGPAYFHWDNIRGMDVGPQRLAKLPPWAAPDAARRPEAQALQKAIEQLQPQLAEKSADADLGEALKSGGSATRQLAVYGLAAIDDLPRVLEALGDPKDPLVREAAVEALRHWLGRGPGQDMQLYNYLVKRGQYSERQAEIVLTLLHGFSLDDRDRPEIYETLIAYLLASKVPIRELARWHLYRWVPAGKDIPYDPAGAEDDHKRAVQAWKKLIPDGKLPPRLKSTGE
jgi:hypothetical protein